LVVLLFLIYSYFPPSPLPPLFNLTLILYTTSAAIELIAERWYLETLKEWETLTSVRVRIEGAAVVTKALGTLLTMLLASRLDGRSGAERYALMAFGIGQVVYSLTLFSGFWFSVRGRSTLSRGWVIQKILTKGEGEKQVDSRYFDGEMKDLGWALTKQSFVKQLLTEGDKIIVGRFSKVEDQGGYAVALGYGKWDAL
jgi:oligosaccharide translocation protein RFT1